MGGGGVKKPLKFLCAILALFFISFSAHAVTLNFQHGGTTKQIKMDTIKRTTPAFAAQIGDTIYYANMVTAPETRVAGSVYVAYDNNVYEVRDNNEYKFTITTTNLAAGDTFSFTMSAAGDFVVDWGDGNVETISRTNTNAGTYSHTYATAGTRTIGFDGRATGYSTDNYTAAIKFYEFSNNSHQKIIAISGSLGAIFPTIGDGTANNSQPRFYQTFQDCTGLTSIPSGLFDGISGAADYMFYFTFYGCSGLTDLPSDLFDGISGAASYMFGYTFQNCTGLTNLPSDLFNGISGAANYMFTGTFNGCSGLTSLPSGLFGGISGAAMYMFYSTFRECGGLTDLPSGLFSGISGAADAMFSSTFYGCSGLRGYSPKINGKYLYEIYDYSVGDQCYYGATGLSDYDNIPDGWK